MSFPFTKNEEIHAYFCFVLFCVCLFDFFAQGITIFKNSVAYVHPAAFQGLRRLQSLIIYSAQLHVAPFLRFIGHSLKTLDLSNSKVEFKSGYFKHGYIMQTLTVVSSDLREMPISLHMIAESLETLSLSDNSITTLKPLYRIRFTQLKWLFLSSNKISSLDSGALLLPRLRAMNLNDNRIRQMTDISTVSWGRTATGGSQPQVYLDGNPWHCNASMNWLLQGLHRSQRGIIVAQNVSISSVEKWFCATPREYQGRVFVNVLPIKPTPRNQGNEVNPGIFSLSGHFSKSETNWYVNDPPLWIWSRFKHVSSLWNFCILHFMQNGISREIDKNNHILLHVVIFSFSYNYPVWLVSILVVDCCSLGLSGWQLSSLCHQVICGNGISYVMLKAP